MPLVEVHYERMTFGRLPTLGVSLHYVHVLRGKEGLFPAPIRIVGEDQKLDIFVPPAKMQQRLLEAELLTIVDLVD